MDQPQRSERGVAVRKRVFSKVGSPGRWRLGRWQWLAAVAGCLAAAPGAFPSAFAVNENGVRAEGMGGAFTSVADDASAIFFNPAGIVFQKGLQMEMDSLVVNGLFRYFPSAVPPGTDVPSNGYSGSVKPHFIPVASLYMTKSLSDRLAVGFGGFAPFGLAANFTNFNDGDPQNTKFVGRFAGTRAALQAYWFMPVVAYKITPNSAISVGAGLVHTHLFLEESFLNPYDAPTDFGRSLARDAFPGVDPNLAWAAFARILPEGRLRAAATTNAPGFTAGYLYKNVQHKFNFGVSWRSPVVSHLNGKASFAFTNTGAITPFLPFGRTLATEFPNQAIKGLLTTPGNYQVGVSTSKFFNSVIAVDFQVQDFRRFQDLPINFSITQDSQGRAIGTDPEKRLNFNFTNSYILHVGIEKHFGPKTALRLGYIFDHSPVPDKSVGPLFPDSSRNSLTVGMSRLRGNMEFSLFYQAMFFMDRVTNVAANNYQFTNGDYNNFANLAGAGMRLHLGKPPATP
jgi:long-chain fatty acid transport protein